jgi:hypothetical protein
MTRTRRFIVLGVAMLLVAAVVLCVLERVGPGNGNVEGIDARSILALTLTDTARPFETLLQKHWVVRDPKAPDTSETGISTWPITRLRYSMFVDSLLLVPAYTGLLVLGLFVLHRRLFAPTEPGRVAWLLHALCVLPVLAAVFDIAENGMLIRAAEDALGGILADPTLADMRDASHLKWAWIALASLLCGAVSLAAWRLPRAQALRHAWTLPAAAALAVLAFALLMPGTPWHSAVLLQWGARAFGALLLLTARNAWVLDAPASTPMPQRRRQ